MATQVAERTANPVAVIRQNLTAMAPEFRAALPAHISVEKFTRVAQTAIQNNPALIDADRRSLFGAIVRLAQDGLLPDGREAALVMFGNKAQAMPMIAGVLKKIRQSGDVAKISSQVVYENDHFVVKYGFDEDVEHIPPSLDTPRGKPIGAYATAVLKDGEHMLEVMSLEQIEKVRAVSRAARNGPWVAWWEEMARKTVMRRLSKRLPMSTDLEDEVFSRDETLAHTAREQVDPQIVDQAPASRLDALEQHIDEQGADDNANPADNIRAAHQAEGPDDSQRGETHTDDHPLKSEVEVIKARIAASRTAKDLGNVETEYLAIAVSLPADVADEIEAMLTEKRNTLRAAA